MPDDDEFASVVLDEEFVRSALFHEPTARERALAVAEGPALPPGRPGRYGSRGAVLPEPADDDSVLESDELYAQGHPYRTIGSRWHRPVAWALAVVLGVGVVALTFAAVYRGAGSGRTTTPPPPAPPIGSSATPAVHFAPQP
ncbi:hypothetical protein [Streptomyces sp. CA2R106]|uniref:SCO2583/SCO2584 N-terminal domain-containing protein n=1 Tax=unclassified Actinacidiphila TaxID=2995708 RepID=UPI003009E317